MSRFNSPGKYRGNRGKAAHSMNPRYGAKPAPQMRNTAYTTSQNDVEPPESKPNETAVKTERPPPHPVSALYEYCQLKKIMKPIYEEQDADSPDPKKPAFSYILQVAGCVFGPSLGSTKNEAKTRVSMEACECLGLENSGLKVKDKKDPKEIPKSTTNVISLLYEYCQLREWPRPKDELVRDDAKNLEKRFGIRYTIGSKNLPVGVGRSKDIAKKRAAARALATLKSVDLRDCFYGQPLEPLGKSVAEHAWEAFGILCEELGETQRFCQTSQLAAFVLENLEDGSFRAVSLGTGSQYEDSYAEATATCNQFVRNGESVIDSHAVVIARRGLLLFFYEQLLKLFECDDSIFEYAQPVASLKADYKIHLYMKEPPCGDASRLNHQFLPEPTHIELRDHGKVYAGFRDKGAVSRKEGGFVVSCSDKILLWNFVGVQGNVLLNFIPPIDISSITVSHNYSADVLARGLCCRLERPTNHPWICHGPMEGILPSTSQNDWRKCWAMYWSHANMDLNEDIEEMVKNAGILNANTGTHLHGSTRDKEIPMICKRNLFRKYKKICLKTNKRCFDQDTYMDIKNTNSTYKIRKNEFFMQLDALRLGRFPIMDRNVDVFKLTPNDLKVDDDDIY